MSTKPYFTITREIAATPDRVFDVLVTPEEFAAWWGGDQVTVPLDTVAIDARPGGEWKATMQLPDGSTKDWVGEYVEVERPTRLVYTITDDATNPARDTVIFTVAASDIGSTLTASQHGGGLPEEYHEAVTAGWTHFVDTIAAVATA